MYEWKGITITKDWEYQTEHMAELDTQRTTRLLLVKDEKLYQLG